MLHSFGGRTQSVPHVDIKCTVNSNSIKVREKQNIYLIKVDFKMISL